MISSTTNRVAYSGDGTSATFAFQYEFHADADLDVYIWNSARTVATVAQVITTDYVISGTKDAQNRYTSGANVIFNSTPASGDKISIVRDLSATQPFNLKFNQVIPNADIIKALDRLALVEQRLGEYLGRGVRISDSFPLTFDATLPDRLPKNAPLIVSSSGLQMDTGVVAFNGTTAAAYFGILPVPNGGTGVDFSQLAGLVYSPGNNTTFNLITNAAQGWVLAANASSAPTFQVISAALINSGIIGVSYGGTGTGTSYTQYGVITMSSATQMTSTAAGGKDQPLVGNNGAAPSYQSLTMSSGSSVTGILRQINGGTGSASSWVVNNVLFQESALAIGQIPSAAAGTVLMQNASSAPTFQAIAVTPTAPTTLTANATIANTVTKVVLSSSLYTVQLFDTTGNDGREVELIRENNIFSNVITISCSGAQGVVGVGSSFGVYTINESVKLFVSSGRWLMRDHNAITGWIPFPSTAVGTLITSSGTAPAYGVTNTNNAYWRRVGTDLDIRWDYRATTTGSAGTGHYLLNIPAGMVMDTNLVIVNSGTGDAIIIREDSASLGVIFGGYTGAGVVRGCMMAHTSTTLKGFTMAGATAVTTQQWGATVVDFAASANVSFSVRAMVPIAGWIP